MRRAHVLITRYSNGPLNAEVAAGAGFTEQSQLSRHFKRRVGVTPRQFRTPARIA